MPTLIVIDLQEAMRAERSADWPWANDAAPAVAGRLLDHARARGWRVIHVHHNVDDPADGFHPSNPLCAAMAEVAPLPGEEIVVKHGSSAFIGTDLAQRLEGEADLVICGGEANMCVESTTRMAGNLGFAVTLVQDALVCFPRRAQDGRIFPPQTVLDMSLANLRGFARIASSEDILSQP
ncbi:isochorismatase family protein [Stagnihabitans tardus]|uniref:Isochorismatase family protein n=1 Tax=Stagnihabitans tardus TaxID=2699202 RepID=A0AAE5BUY7_9RHOB|nr:isochorismatase family protein [Stagnihabitans tardus]NBZ88386.1 isochorismatase family protein [Stagnihabitans tardus]